MAVKAEVVYLDEKMSPVEYAMANKGLYINLLNICGEDPVTHRFLAQTTVSNKNLLGEKVKLGAGKNQVEGVVIYSCLGTDYKLVDKYKQGFKEALLKLEEDYRQQMTLEQHIKTNATDLEQMRMEGKLD